VLSGNNGSGKSDTFKEFCKLLGSGYYLVYKEYYSNFKDTANIFKGVLLSGLTLCIEDADFLDDSQLSFIRDSLIPVFDALRSNNPMVTLGESEYKREFKG